MKTCNLPLPLLMVLSKGFCSQDPHHQPLPGHCDDSIDDIRLYGGGGDAGRVEICHDSRWRYICPPSEKHELWNVETTAIVACRELGYRSAFMAKLAKDMAMGSRVVSGVDESEAGMRLSSCAPNATSLKECNLLVDSSCGIEEAVGMACSTDLPGSSDVANGGNVTRVGMKLVEMSEFQNFEYHRVKRNRSKRRSLLEDIKLHPPNVTAACPEEEGDESSHEEYNVPIPDPLRDTEEIEAAFIFPKDVSDSYKELKESFEVALSLWSSKSNVSLTTEVDLVRSSVSKLQWNVLGLDFSNFFPKRVNLEETNRILTGSPEILALRDLYLSANNHSAMHWFLDSPYRYYSQPSPPLDPRAQTIFENLQKYGLALIDDFGADIDAIVDMAEASLSGEGLRMKNQTVIGGGGGVVTSRIPMPPAEDLLLRNSTIASVIEAYQGPSVLHGYKVTRLTSHLKSEDQYLAGLYHHDRVGRRLKLFVFLHDVDCVSGHPTQIAAGTHKLLYYKTEDYPSTRFKEEYVHSNFDIKLGCGKKGGGLIFDTHTIHRGSVSGTDERTVLIAEYHNEAKCAYTKENRLAIPCPGGDIYRSDIHL